MSEQIIYTAVIVLILFILYSLGSALFFLVKDKSEDSRRTVKALTVRIVLSITLFLLLMLSFMMGWIQPHGILPN